MDNVRRLLINGGKVLLAGCVFRTFQNHVCDFWIIAGNSMEPTVYDGQIVVGWSSGWINLNNLKRGDVIVARSPTQPKETICKRIVGLQGDRVPANYKGPELFVPAGQVWLEGDHKAVSRDSNTFGAVPLNLVQGKLICRVWPFDLSQEKINKII
eukprot:TRINITY_DN16902_c1_g1_i1.p1 TRINITY_DN16902_c1_g1~~TRINITY_DN16902_c1_g1_i1.p1  ORF type:complete len:155 (+),score=8.08 TRINITY_DN16902_c1_g1_i1:34-498(+)